MTTIQNSLKAYFDFYYGETQMPMGYHANSDLEKDSPGSANEPRDDSGLWKYFVSVQEEMRVLEIGARHNSQIHNLFVADIDCTQIDTSHTHLQESQRRYSATTAVNKLKTYSIDQIPDRFGSKRQFDVVLIDVPSTERQELFLRQGQDAYQGILNYCQKILKPDGILVVFASNKYSFSNLQLRHILFTNDSSRKTHLKQLEKAGFFKTQCYTPRVSGNHVEGYFGLNTSALNDTPLPLSPPKDWKQALRESYLTSSYLFLSRASDLPPKDTLLNMVVSDISTHLHEKFGQGRLDILNSFITRKRKLVLEATWQNRQVIVKIPQCDMALRSETNNFSVLNAISNQIGEDNTPTPLAKGIVTKQRYFVESLLPGVGLSLIANGVNRDYFLPGIFDLLKNFYSMGNVGDGVNVTVLDGLLYQDLVQSKIERIASATGQEGLAQLLEEFFSSSLKGEIIPMGMLHGDFSVSNLWTNGGEISGVIDWETGHLNNIAALDAINYLDSSLRLHNPGMLINQTIPSLADRKLITDGENAFLEECYKMYGLDSKLHRPIVYLRWLYHINYLLDFWLGTNFDAQKIYIHEIADTLR